MVHLRRFMTFALPFINGFIPLAFPFSDGFTYPPRWGDPSPPAARRLARSPVLFEANRGGRSEANSWGFAVAAQAASRSVFEKSSPTKRSGWSASRAVA